MTKQTRPKRPSKKLDAKLDDEEIIIHLKNRSWANDSSGFCAVWSNWKRLNSGRGAAWNPIFWIRFHYKDLLRTQQIDIKTLASTMSRVPRPKDGRLTKPNNDDVAEFIAMLMEKPTARARQFEADFAWRFWRAVRQIQTRRTLTLPLVLETILDSKKKGRSRGLISGGYYPLLHKLATKRSSLADLLKNFYGSQFETFEVNDDCFVAYAMSLLDRIRSDMLAARMISVNDEGKMNQDLMMECLCGMAIEKDDKDPPKTDDQAGR